MLHCHTVTIYIEEPLATFHIYLINVENRDIDKNVNLCLQSLHQLERETSTRPDLSAPLPRPQLREWLQHDILLACSCLGYLV
jgi:hypothetical protein